MFGEPTSKNRRFTPQEYEGELEVARIFLRPPRQYIFDTPYYPFFPPTPILPRVNFDLNYK